MVWGEVHDENAWSFGGVAGHAGVFSTAADLAVLAQTMINGGAYGGHRILRRASVRQMITNDNEAFPGDEHGLGFELDQRWYMGGLELAAHGGPHRLHRHLAGDRLRVPVVRDLADQPGAPAAVWGSVNRPARVAPPRAWPRRCRPAARRRDAWFSGTANARDRNPDRAGDVAAG